MMNMDIFQLFFNHLEERPYNNIYQNMKQDADYLEASLLENELNEQYKKLDLSDEQRKVITQWIEAILKNTADTVFIFCYKRIFSPPLHPLVSAIVTWMFWNRQVECYKVITC